MRTRKTGTIRARPSACALEDIAIRVPPGLLPTEREAARSTCLAGPTYNDPTAARTLPGRAGARGRTRGRKGEENSERPTQCRKRETGRGRTEQSGAPGTTTRAQDPGDESHRATATALSLLCRLGAGAAHGRNGTFRLAPHDVPSCKETSRSSSPLRAISARRPSRLVRSKAPTPHLALHCTSPPGSSSSPRAPNPHRQRRTRQIPILIRCMPFRDALPPRFSARRKTRNQKNAEQNRGKNSPDSNSSVASSRCPPGRRILVSLILILPLILNWVLQRHRQRIRVHRPHTRRP
jgi:hypothetical protein